MKLDRHKSPYRQKYALLLNRKLQGEQPPDIQLALETLEKAGVIDWGDGESEFFVIRLKDRFAVGALVAYADAAHANGEEEFAGDVWKLAEKSAKMPNRKMPD